MSPFCSTGNLSQNGTLPVNSTVAQINVTKSIVYTVICGVFMVVMCGGNGLFILAYNTRKELQTIANFLLVHLAFADFTVGFCMPFYMVFFWSPTLDRNGFMCALRYSILIFPIMASVFFLVLVGIDRYIAISRPLKYVGFITKKNVTIASVIVWTIAVTAGGLGPIFARKDCHDICDMLAILKWEYLGAFLFPIFVTVTVLMTFFYAGVFLMVVRKDSSLGKIISGQKSAQQIAQRCRTEKAVAITVLLVVGVFYVCWCPLFTIIGIQLYSNRVEDPGLNKYRIAAARFLGVANSAVNVFIYVFRLPKFRNAVASMLCKGRRGDGIMMTSSGTGNTSEGSNQPL